MSNGLSTEHVQSATVHRLVCDCCGMTLQVEGCVPQDLMCQARDAGWIVDAHEDGSEMVLCPGCVFQKQAEDFVRYNRKSV